VVVTLLRSTPHRHQFVANIVDQYTTVLNDAGGQDIEHVIDPRHRLPRTNPVANRAEASDVTEEHRDFRFPSVQQAGAGFQLPCQFGNEKLFELDTCLDGNLLLLEASQRMGYLGGNQFHHHGFQVGNFTPTNIARL